MKLRWRCEVPASSARPNWLTPRRRRQRRSSAPNSPAVSRPSGMSNAVVMITPRVIVAVVCGADGAGMIRQEMERMLLAHSAPPTALHMVLRLNAGSSLLIGLAMELAHPGLGSHGLAVPGTLHGTDT